MYTVFVAENSAYMEERMPGGIGDYATWDEAVAAARRVVERSLRELFAPPMDAEHLFRLYTTFGDDAYIVPAGETRAFSAWDYARQRCQEICAPRS